MANGNPNPNSLWGHGGAWCNVEYLGIISESLDCELKFNKKFNKGIRK